MRHLQRWLSDVFNLFVRDQADPERLWPWWELCLYGGVVVGCFVVLTRLG